MSFQDKTVNFNFSGAKVLVTGGSSGIGHGVATAFAEADATITYNVGYDPTTKPFTVRM